MEITFILSEEDLSILNEALVQLPYGKVAPLINKLNKQINEQQQKLEGEKDGK